MTDAEVEREFARIIRAERAGLALTYLAWTAAVCSLVVAASGITSGDWGALIPAGILAGIAGAAWRRSR